MWIHFLNNTECFSWWWDIRCSTRRHKVSKGYHWWAVKSWEMEKEDSVELSKKNCMLASVAFRSQHHFSLASQLWLTAHDFPPPVSHVIKASREIFVLMCCAADENNQGEDYGAETEQKSVSLDSPNSVGHWKVGWRESLGLWCWSSVKNSVKPLGFGTSKRGSTVQSGGFFLYTGMYHQDKTRHNCLTSECQLARCCWCF